MDLIFPFEPLAVRKIVHRADEGIELQGFFEGLGNEGERYWGLLVVGWERARNLLDVEIDGGGSEKVGVGAR